MAINEDVKKTKNSEGAFEAWWNTQWRRFDGSLESVSTKRAIAHDAWRACCEWWDYPNSKDGEQ